MKKKLLIGILLFIVIIMLSLSVFQHTTSETHPEVLSDLQGTIYYTERVDGILTLFKSDANLENKTLLYSHKGKGKDSYDGYNDNIGDFYYDKNNQTIDFIAMKNGDWCLFSLKEGEDEPILLEENVMEIETDYITNQFNEQTASSQQGSLYLNDKIIKKFYGMYDAKWTGYHPLGFSPDGKYLVYHSMEHLTPFGSLLDGFITDSFGNKYIMDLSTMKSAKYIDSNRIQWFR